MVDALRLGEEHDILRGIIEMALAGDKSAIRFCAKRIDEAGRAEHAAPPPSLALTRAEMLDPFLLHAKLMQAAIEGAISADEALKLVRLFAAKERLRVYTKSELTDAEYDALAEVPEAEGAPENPPPPSGGEGRRLADPPPRPFPTRGEGEESAVVGEEDAGERERGQRAALNPLPPCGGGSGWGVVPAQPIHPPVNHLFGGATR